MAVNFIMGRYEMEVGEAVITVTCTMTLTEISRLWRPKPM